MNEKKWDLSRLDTGSRSVLKRNAGIMIGQDMRAIEALWRAAGSVPKGREAQWFACLCMECLWKPEEGTRTAPFEEMLRRWYRDETGSDSLKRRIVSLLDVPWSEDGFLLGKLCGFARRMKAENSSEKPDFSKLADDLVYWNDPEHRVQRRWIRIICGTENILSSPDNSEQTIKETEEPKDAD